jgi:hypothetical protein
MWNLAPLMCSGLNVEYAQQLAGKNIPMHMVGYTNGLSAKSIDELKEFFNGLRAQSISNYYYRQLPIKTSIEEGWRTALLDPAQLAKKISETQKLL